MAIRRLAAGVEVEQIHAALGDAAFWVDTAGGRFSILGVPARTFAWTDDVDAQMRAALGPRRSSLPVDVPFAFHGGLIGYLDYEGGAFFGWVDQFAVVDHREREIWLVGEEAFIADLDARMHAPVSPVPIATQGLPPHRFLRDDARYLDDIARCFAHIAAGDSYEICLTNQVIVDARPDPTRLFRILRRTNPAPYAALLRGPSGAVVSSSPELFLAIDRAGNVTTKPIKGTAPRGGTPAEDVRIAHELATSEKTRSENLMIVDLLRNDLGIVCAIGSVAVPELMVVESYASVHQLVSRITGRLRADVDALDCVRAAFPGGSMTGAPKRKTMEILAALEGAPRGIYSGALGWFSVDGAAELAIVIRTAMIGERTTIGVGGAITALSDAPSELAEMKLKADPVLRAIAMSLAPDEAHPARGPSMRQR